MPQDFSATHEPLVALVGSQPLVVFVENWTPGTVENVTYVDEQVTYEGEPVTYLVF